VNPTRKTLWAWAIATFFGAGYLKPGPGTYGSIATVLLWFACLHLHPLNAPGRALFTLLAAVIVTAIGIPAATIVARESGRKDPGFVVIDEVAGQLVVLLFARALWPDILLALILFRLFDIWKPWPVRRFELFPGGTGIVVDDLAAGVYGLIAFYFLLGPLLLLIDHLH
jgi:phosphatidylglycerophosphatase A